METFRISCGIGDLKHYNNNRFTSNFNHSHSNVYINKYKFKSRINTIVINFNSSELYYLKMYCIHYRIVTKCDNKKHLVRIIKNICNRLMLNNTE